MVYCTAFTVFAFCVVVAIAEPATEKHIELSACMIVLKSCPIWIEWAAGELSFTLPRFAVDSRGGW
jgi:hypothetical protein